MSTVFEFEVKLLLSTVEVFHTKFMPVVEVLKTELVLVFVITILASETAIEESANNPNDETYGGEVIRGVRR